MNSLTPKDLQANRDRILSQIQKTCEECGRNPETVKLMWVSKTRPVTDLQLAYIEGARIFGESKVQECLLKFPLENCPDARLHFIGRLQSNKVRKIVPLCEAIHSVDSLSLLHKIHDVCTEIKITRDVFIQINTSGEASKAGFSEESFLECLPGIGELPHLNVLGFMTIGPNTEDLSLQTAAFHKLARLRDRIQAEFLHYPVLKSLKQLSMGMSHDFTVAIKAGSHYIRIGTDLFGVRENSF